MVVSSELVVGKKTEEFRHRISIYPQTVETERKGGGKKRELGGRVRKKGRKDQKGWDSEILSGQTQQTSGTVCKHQTYQKYYGNTTHE